MGGNKNSTKEKLFKLTVDLFDSFKFSTRFYPRDNSWQNK